MGWRLSITTTAPSISLALKMFNKTLKPLPFMDPFRVINPTTFVKLIAWQLWLLLPDKRVLNRRLLPHFERAWVRVNPNLTPISSKKRGCSGRCFSLAPNTQTSRFALCPWQPDYSVFFFRVNFFVLSSRHIILGLTASLWLSSQYSQYSNKVLSGYFSTISVNWVVRECNTL